MPKDRADLQFFKEFTSRLEPDDNFYLVGIEHGASIFDQDFLQNVSSLTDSLSGLHHVVRAQSLANLRRPLKTPFSLTSIPVLHVDDSTRYRRDRTKLLADPIFGKRFISKDEKSTVIAVKTASNLNQKQARILDAAIRAQSEKWEFKDVHYAGKANIQTEFVRLIQEEMIFYVILSIIVLILALIIFFRKWWTVVIAILSVLLGAIFFAGFVGLTGTPLNVMAMLFPVLMLIVGISDVVHFFSKYNDELHLGNSKEASMHTAVREIGWATFLTSLTTSVGFLSLVFSKIQPIREFGMLAAAGVMIAFFTVLFFTTSALLLVKPERVMTRKKQASLWVRYMKWNFFFVEKQQKWIVIVSGFVLALALAAMTQISTNAYILSDVPENSKLKQDAYFFQDNLAGVRSFEMAVHPLNNLRVTDPKVLTEIEKMTNFLENETPVHGVISPATSFMSLNRAYNSDRSSAFKLPENTSKYPAFRRALRRLKSSGLNVVMTDQQDFGRITGLMDDLGTSKVRELLRKIDSWQSENIQTDLVKFSPTGTALVLDKNNQYLSSSLLTSLCFALIVVSLLMALLFKDVVLVIITLLPNVIPLFITAGIIGLMGIELKASTSIIFAIAFGIAVDDTIHFLSKFKLERDKGKRIRESLYHTYVDTGQAITKTTIILLMGFSLLVFSDFNGVYYVGLLVSITLLLAWLTCMYLTPVFIRWFMKDKNEVATGIRLRGLRRRPRS